MMMAIYILSNFFDALKVQKCGFPLRVAVVAVVFWVAESKRTVVCKSICFLLSRHTTVTLNRTISKQQEIPQSAEHTPSTYRAPIEHLMSVFRP